MSLEILDEIHEIVKDSPHSSQSLLLFALLKTLDVEKSGHMYMLEKLKEMTPDSRQLAYGAMELMVDNKIHDQEWKTKLELIENTIRSNN